MSKFDYEIHHLNLALNELTQKIKRAENEEQKAKLEKFKEEYFKLLDILEEC